MAPNHWLRPEVYPLFAATGVAVAMSGRSSELVLVEGILDELLELLKSLLLRLGNLTNNIALSPPPFGFCGFADTDRISRSTALRLTAFSQTDAVSNMSIPQNHGRFAVSLKICGMVTATTPSVTYGPKYKKIKTKPNASFNEVIHELLLSFAEAGANVLRLKGGGFLGPAFFLTQLSHINSPAMAVLCMACSQGTDAFSQSGLYSNHQDIAPRYSGVLLGLSNTAGVLSGVFGTASTGYILQHEFSRITQLIVCKRKLSYLYGDGPPNERKIVKLCEYAAKNPFRIPKIAKYLEDRCYKELRLEHIKFINIVAEAYNKLLCLCKEQMAYFAVSLLNVVTELLDNPKQDPLRILGCQALTTIFLYSGDSQANNEFPMLNQKYPFFLVVVEDRLQFGSTLFHLGTTLLSGHVYVSVMEKLRNQRI
ncbi:unnamed protein product [Prunus armeniaca]